MANFLETQPRQYNPYVQQLPVEAMVKVGMAKEEQFIEGIKQAQTYVDSIKNLPIDHPEIQKYAQGRLGELKEGITKNIGGDFSDPRLINEINNAASTIYSDPIIQNGIRSTIQYRSDIANADTEAKAGKNNLTNVEYFRKRAAQWLTDKQANAVYSSSYIPHTDVMKEVQDILKNIGEDSQLAQQLFITDGSGNLVLKDGMPQYNDVMAETLLKGKDKGKILGALQTGLSANAKRQLEIDGEYNFRGYSSGQLQREVNDTYKEYQKLYMSAKEDLQDSLVKLSNSTNVDNYQEKRDAIMKQIASLDSDFENKKRSLNETAIMAVENPDAIRSSLYASNFMQGISGAFSSRVTEKKFLKNPAVEVMMDKERLNIAKQAEARQQSEFNRGIYEDDRDFNYKVADDQRKYDLDVFKAQKEKSEKDKKAKGVGEMRDLPVDNISNPLYFQTAAEEGLNADIAQQFTNRENLAIAYMVSANGANGKTVEPDSIIKTMKSWAKDNGETYEQLVARFSQKAIDSYTNDKSPMIGPEFSSMIKDTKDLDISINTKLTKKAQEKEYIRKNAAGFTPFDLEKADIKPFKLDDKASYWPVGKDFKGKTLSKEVMYNLALISAHEGSGPLFAAFDSKQSKSSSQNARDKLNSLGYTNDQIDGLLNAAREKSIGLEKSPFGKAIDNAVKLIANDSYKKTTQLKEQFWKENSSVTAPKALSINTATAEDRGQAKQDLTAVLSDYKGVISDYSDLIDDINEKDVQGQVVVIKPDSKYKQPEYRLEIMRSNGKVVKQTITPGQFKTITGMDALNSSDNLVTEAIRGNARKSTNFTYDYRDPDAFKGAMFDHGDFPNVKDHNVAMDMVQGPDGMFYPKIYVKQPEGSWKLLEYQQAITPQDAMSFPQKLDDSVLIKLLNKK